MQLELEVLELAGPEFFLILLQNLSAVHTGISQLGLELLLSLDLVPLQHLIDFFLLLDSEDLLGGLVSFLLRSIPHGHGLLFDRFELLRAVHHALPLG